MGNQKPFPRFQVARAVTSYLTSNAQLAQSELDVERWKLSVERLLCYECQGGDSNP
jgi:hypothetical protein